MVSYFSCTGEKTFGGFSGTSGDKTFPGPCGAIQPKAGTEGSGGKARNYFLHHEGGSFLFNCKPRFGKTLTVYDLCKSMGFINILVVTNRPAIADSWFEDYCKFLGKESGYRFVSEVSVLKNKPGVWTRENFTKLYDERMLQI